jgi:hypothetical protein
MGGHPYGARTIDLDFRYLIVNEAFCSGINAPLSRRGVVEVQPLHRPEVRTAARVLREGCKHASTPRKRNRELLEDRSCNLRPRCPIDARESRKNPQRAATINGDLKQDTLTLERGWCRGTVKFLTSQANQAAGAPNPDRPASVDGDATDFAEGGKARQRHRLESVRVWLPNGEGVTHAEDY